ncbi:glycerophosphoryl diester phosphodiesterase [Erythrobacter litoralis]|jgi:glycerophosphoryl diester phosphodiesterase|uniref:GP-PDE domain-containing protein n=1 Tax=Erythrobacter litoralis TaxID=39960 RepID=A0A074MD52_9SPHN|nr:glycerophosphodiester phosphodiesterase family protein [Erythrobacter litoralis]AOL22078.1 glycerophosphoryl diester phosphodiesterase [Erythrobacter litoralis]KEO90665.1 hypothetical protein EH32_02260 [Erythrobacter litoralis]MEE4339085.1 glycerophosphodiester phosphodiesterase family protein [Erythrobacter sp.]
MKRPLLWGGFAIALLFLGLTILNASWLAPYPAGAPKQVAQGALSPLSVAQPGEECASARIEPPYHRHLANTKESVLRAAKMGAWLVEVDARLAAGGEVVLFSDARLDCLTDGRGPVREASLARLRALDAGHGYSADGESYPFRGRGAKIETLSEVARAMPRRGRLVVHLASDNPALVEGVAAAYRRSGRDPVQAQDAFYGPAEAIAAIRKRYPDVWAFNPDAARQCTADYVAQGWSGFLPESCKGRTMLIALDEQALLWGWPNRLIARMGASGGRIVIEGPQASAAGPIAGVTLPEQLTEIPASFNGYIWSGDAFTTLPALITRFDDRTQEEIDASQAALERRRAVQ